MPKTIMTVLGHCIEYETDLLVDQEMLNEIHDAIHDQIISGEWLLTEDKSGEIEMLCEWDNSSPYTLLHVNWKIVNPEAAKWKELAESMYTQLKLWAATIVVETHLTKLVVKRYEEVIKQQENVWKSKL
jgi:hypothetical protein